jgi:hypothetical protein
MEMGLMTIRARGIPENMERLYQGEEQLRIRSIASIHADEALLDHVELIEAVMDHLDFFAKRDAVDIDQETIQLLGARIFNDLASAYGQLTRGYYQIAASILRDIMEIIYLWGWFDRDPTMITRWREADDKERHKIFSPVKVRKFLDNFDGYTDGKRGAAYKMFCEYAAHATWQGFTLMRPTGGGAVEIGPFFDAPLMKALLEEMAQLAGQAGDYFSCFSDNTGDDIPALKVWLRLYVVTGEWAEKYLGRPHDREFVSEMGTWLVQLEAQ